MLTVLLRLITLAVLSSGIVQWCEELHRLLLETNYRSTARNLGWCMMPMMMCQTNCRPTARNLGWCMMPMMMCQTNCRPTARNLWWCMMWMMVCKRIILPALAGNELYWQCCGNRLWLRCDDEFLSCLATNYSTMTNCINCTACVVTGLNWLRCGNYNV